MRISVVLPDDLATDLETCRRQEGRTTSKVVRDALALYLREHRRRAAGNALQRLARANPLSEAGLRRALAELEDERGRSDRL
jgi:metal-responsive CopG/Arc/MetJ family transcriptional regulator